MLDYGSEQKYINDAIEALNVGKIIVQAYHDNISCDAKKEILTVIAQRKLIYLELREKKFYVARSTWISSIGVNEFFRTCCIFKERPREIPKEFIIGRISTGQPIFLRLNGEFTDPGIWYDEAIRHPFLLFCLFLYVGI